VAVFKQPQRVVACEDIPWCESRVVAVKGNDHNKFRSGSCRSYSEDGEGFGLKVTRNLCVRKNRIKIEREGAKSGQEQQAQKMVSLSNSRLPAVDIGTNVVIRVPDLDQGHLAPRNVLAVVIGVNSSGLHLLDTKDGLLEWMHARDQFTTADNFIEAHDVPSSSPSLRSASMITEVGSDL